MAAEPKRIRVTPGSELAEIIKEASRGPVVLESNGERYRLDRMEREKDDLWEGYDPEKVREAIKKYAGSIKDVDPDEWIADVYRAREEGSRPPDRP